MSDTPITDSSIIERRHIHKRGGSVELLELLDANVSRKLERERDEAQAQIAVYEAERSILANELRQLRAEVAKYQADEDDYVQLTPKGIALLDGRL